MTFNTAVSGLKAANSELSVVGNNIANTSTTGFKSARAEFADVYALSALGASANTIGSGIQLSAVKQQFNQGNISVTNNALDIAINGEGFFTLNNQGATEYTRSGIFGVDEEGFVVSAGDRRLQGFPANEEGAISTGELTDIQISREDLEPSGTTEATLQLNLDAQEVGPAERGTTAEAEGDVIGSVSADTVNAYPSERLLFTMSDGTTVREIVTVENATAAEIASAISALPEVSATAMTQVRLRDILAVDPGDMEITLNGVNIFSIDDDLPAGQSIEQAIAIAINQLSNTTLRGITALQDDTGGVTITSTTGEDLIVEMTNSPNADNSLIVESIRDPTSLQLLGGRDAADIAALGLPPYTATVGGTVSITMEEGVTMAAELPSGLPLQGTGLFAQEITVTRFENNSFDPNDQDTYNHATSMTIYDSLGNSHVVSMFYVKDSLSNSWSMYVQVDGEEVGNPNPALDPPDNTLPTRAVFNLQFDDSGVLDEDASDDVFITYWDPKDVNGDPNGAASYDLDGTFPKEIGANDSNFEIDISGLTQFGSNFSVNDISQNGYTAGRVTSIDLSPDGRMVSRYTNGQSLVIGQIPLAIFANVQGLAPVGNTSWVETFESGPAIDGAPGTSTRGLLQSGALEDSNVELSQQLVALIIAQRNFQANAKTIQTADTVTQAIINIR